jgi:hypothetical protein
VSSLLGFDDVAPLTRDELELTRDLVEAAIGRPLRMNERSIDVLGLDKALNDAKDDVEQAVRAEQKRAVARGLRNEKRIALDLTKPMLEPLERLFRLGRREALAELQRAGYPEPRRAFAAVPEHPELDDHASHLHRLLHGFSVRIENRRVEMQAGDYAQDAIAAALLRVPGARDVASRAISKALTLGLAQTFEANQDLVTCWEYTAVLDGGTCDVCAPLDGSEYQTLGDLFVVLPDFGPNPECLGRERCRCRAVPCAA